MFWTEWSPRGSGFGEVKQYDGWCHAVVMSYAPLAHADSSEWQRVRQLWLDLDAHPTLLDAIAPGARDDILLLYTPLHWKSRTIVVRGNMRGRAMVAAWGAQITELYQHICSDLADTELELLFRPLVMTDIGDHARVGFLPVFKNDLALPPESRAKRPVWDERGLVYVIGQAVRELCQGLDADDAAQLRFILDRCTDPNPRKRIRTLVDLRAAWTNIGAIHTVRSGQALNRWLRTEESLGLLALGKPSEAMSIFHELLLHDPNNPFIRAARDEARTQMGPPSDMPAAPPTSRVARKPRFTWSDVKADGEARENARAFGDALTLYRDVRLDGVNDAALLTAIARCQLALGFPGVAVDYAQRALAAGAAVEAMSIRARAYLQHGKPTEALEAAQAWLDLRPSDGAAHYARGRALFALSRFVDAREAFDRALAFAPGMPEALLMRREADRSARRVRAEVGTQPDLEIEVPEHLSDLRGALITGRMEDVLRVLERPEYESDGVARLLHAQCLAFERRFSEAIAMFDHAAALSTEHANAAAVGKGHALLALARADEALAIFDRAAAAKPGDLEAIEGRAQALRALGRDGEADEEQRRVVAASGGRSDVRLGRPR